MALGPRGGEGQEPDSNATHAEPVLIRRRLAIRRSLSGLLASEC